MKHTIAVLVNNKPGVLAKVAGLFARRGYNIDSLVVNATIDGNYPDPQGDKYSRMTIVVDDENDPRIMDQIEKQLNKLIDVVHLSDHTQTQIVRRELALIKIHATPEQRSEVFTVCQVFRALIVDIGEGAITVEVAGAPDKIDALVDVLRPYGIVELVRTGRVVLARGERMT
jgi:acetolactate synthase-1/3 small subunit